MKAGIQLYSLRNLIAEKGLSAVLDIVKNAGFDGVEFAGFGDLTLKQVKEKLLETKLTAIGIHTNINDMTNNFDELTNICKELDTKNLVIAYSLTNFNLGKEQLIDSIKNLTEKYAKKGIQVLYHNHSYEFDGGIDLLKDLITAIPNILLEPDIFWLKASNKEPVSYLNEIKGHVGLIHMKEISALGKDDFNPIVGQGEADAKGVKHYAQKENIEWGILEIEKVNIDIVEYIEKSCLFIKK